MVCIMEREEVDLVLDSLCSLKLVNEPNYITMYSYEDHLGKVEIEGIGKKTCAYCFVKFRSRNELFRHLREMDVDTTPRDVVMENVEINENGKRKRKDQLLYKRITPSFNRNGKENLPFPPRFAERTKSS